MIEAIKKRRSIRSFQNLTVTREAIEDMTLTATSRAWEACESAISILLTGN